MPQQSLFELEPPAWEQDDAGEQLVATVVFATGPEQPFDYAVPDRLRDQIEVGRRVRVPLGKSDRLVTGYLVALDSRQIAGRRLKSVADLVDQRSLLSPGMLRLTKWMADYYLCAWGQVLETVVPAGVRWQAGTREALFVSLAPGSGRRPACLSFPTSSGRSSIMWRRSTKPLTPRQIAQALGCTLAPINLLRKRGLLVSETRRIDAGALRRARGRAAIASDAQPRPANRAGRRFWLRSNRAATNRF